MPPGIIREERVKHLISSEKEKHIWYASVEKQNHSLVELIIQAEKQQQQQQPAAEQDRWEKSNIDIYRKLVNVDGAVHDE